MRTFTTTAKEKNEEDSVNIGHDGDLEDPDEEDMDASSVFEDEHHHHHHHEVTKEGADGRSGVMTAATSNSSEDDDGGAAAARSKRNKLVIGGLILIVIALVVGIVVGVTSSNSSSKPVPAPVENNNEPPTPPSDVVSPPSPTPPPQPEETLAPTVTESLTREEFLKHIIVDQNGWSDATTFADPQSPQSLALEWLTNDDPNQVNHTTPVQTVKQRYILAVLYHATNGAEWDGRRNLNSRSTQLKRSQQRKLPELRFLSGADVCQWNNGDDEGVFCDESENPQTTVTMILLTRYDLQGKLPTEISFLDSLVILRLSK